MTYSTFISRLRSRTLKYSKSFLAWANDAPMFYLANDAIRNVAMLSKDRPSSASLSLVAGTRDYTISSAIGSDVDEIVSIWTDKGEIKAQSVQTFQEDIFLDVTDEDDIVSNTPVSFRVWDGVLRVYPTPSVAATATVYYTIKTSVLTYSTANMAIDVELNDDYLDAALYEAIALVAEGSGDYKGAAYNRAESKRRLEESKMYKPDYDRDNSVKYKGAI